MKKRRGTKCIDTSNFLDILQSVGLTQHVTGPTREDGHTLDFIITRSFGGVESTSPVIDTYVSDHASVLCDINCRKPSEKRCHKGRSSQLICMCFAMMLHHLSSAPRNSLIWKNLLGFILLPWHRCLIGVGLF